MGITGWIRSNRQQFRRGVIETDKQSGSRRDALSHLKQLVRPPPSLPSLQPAPPLRLPVGRSAAEPENLCPPAEDEINESMGLKTAVKGRSRDATDLFPGAGSLLPQTRRDFYMTFLLSPLSLCLSGSPVF